MNMKFNRAPLLSWKSKVHRRVNLAKLCVETGNFGPLGAALARNATLPADDLVATVRKSIAIAGDKGPSQDDLKDLNLKLISSSNGRAQKMLERLFVLTLRESSPKKLLEAYVKELEDHIKGNNHAIDDIRSSGIDIIDKLPEDAQDAAGELFTTGIEIATTVYREFGPAIEKVGDAFGRHANGSCHDDIKLELHQASAVIESVSRVAIKWIYQLFGHDIPKQSSSSTSVSGKLGSVLEEFAGQKWIGGENHLSLRKTVNGWEICSGELV